MQASANTLSRTKKGCRTCRLRKIKCDEKKPKCQRCIKSDLECSYGLHLIWHEESLSKGVCHGRSGVWSKNGPRGQIVKEEPQELPLRVSSERMKRDYKQGNTNLVNRERGTGNSYSVFLNTTAQDVKLYFEYGGMIIDDDGDERDDESQRRLSDQSMIGQQCPLSLPVLNNTTLGTARTLDYDSTLLSFYESVVCSSRTLLDDSKNNPYRHLILPMAMNSEGLYHATLAISAQIRRISEPQFRFAAMEHGHKALKYLIASLERGGVSRSSASNERIWSSKEVDEILGLALMLCWFEITDSCRSSWVTHLKGIYTLISQYQDVFSRNSRTSDVTQFFNRYFSFHLVLARTAFRVEDDISFSNSNPPNTANYSNSRHTSPSTSSSPYSPYNNKNETNNNGPPMSKAGDFLSLGMTIEDPDEIDAYMGFSNSLLMLINEIADLGRKYPTKAAVEADLPLVREQVQGLRSSLERLHQKPPPLNKRNGGSTLPDNYSHEEDLAHTIAEFQAIAEANRLGALLLLHEVCVTQFQRPDLFGTGRRGSAGTTITMNASYPNYNGNSGSEGDYDPVPPTDYKTRYVRGILDSMMQNINEISRTAALPLWPLFIAGCCVTTEEDQITVLRIFDETEKLKRYGNVTPARQVIEMIWRQRDLGVQDDRKRRHTAAMAMSSIAGDGSSSSLTSTSSKLLKRRLHPSSPLASSSKTDMQLFEWERAMMMMGGLKLSLT